MRLFQSNHLIKLITKILALASVFVILIAVSFGSNMLVQQVIEREKASLRTYADIYIHFATNENIENALFFLDVVTPTIYFPMIITDANDEPIQDYLSYTLNIEELHKINSIETQRQYLLKMINKMKMLYSPIIVPGRDGTILAKFYYTHSTLVDYLRFFPLFSVLTVMAMVAIGYVAFNSAKNNEQSRVWVGMAKETAHQLGTPISSLMAWIELLKLNNKDPEIITETALEIENDIKRLDIIATRFSKIGSQPDMKIINISEIIDEVCRYYEKRLPYISGKIVITRNYNANIHIKANAMLMAWVFENIIKNSVEAIEGQKGEISISAKKMHNKKIQFLIKDTGKGMGAKLKLQIFEPGFTTKKRGWGIGLNLVKRIIEEYHNGKIYVKESALNRGTTFAIELPIENMTKKEQY